jgi:phosphoglycolate phosphatase
MRGRIAWRWGGFGCPYAEVVEPLVVGFDLDLTLINSRPGIGATYRALSARTGVFIDSDAALHRLGPPLEVELALWFPATDVSAMADEFRRIYPDFAVTSSPALPGVVESFAAVRRHAGRIIVITGKYEPNAQRHLRHLGLAVDAVVGWAWAEGKMVAMLTHGTHVYVGDHPADMAGARAAPPPTPLGGLTGDHSEAELLDAGADVVLPDLSDFPAWLDSYRSTARISVGLGGTDR